MRTISDVAGSFALSCCIAACSGASGTPAGPGTGGVIGAGGRGDLGGTTSSSSPATTTSGGHSAAGGILPASGGASTGGQSSGGAAAGGQASGGAAMGGASTGGASTGGVATGGTSTSVVAMGGRATGGASSGVVATGGTRLATGGNAPTGGKASGGAAAGGAPTGGSAAGGNGGAGGATGTCPSGGWAPGKQTISTQWGGVARQYAVYVPKSYTGTSPVPLMLVIHGAHNTPAMAESWSQMSKVADQNGFIIAYPAGLDCWNAGGILGGCTAADDDLGFLKNVVTEVESHACIDQKRVYATGISNGAMMAQYLGCKAADIFASVGGVAGPTPGQCSPSRPISDFYVHGTEDKTVGFSSAQPNVTGWANRDGCSTTPVETYNQGSTKCVTYQGCKDGVEVVFCTVTGMGHCWPEDTSCMPGGGAQYGVTDFKASPMMWEFFSQHPMP